MKLALTPKDENDEKFEEVKFYVPMPVIQTGVSLQDVKKEISVRLSPLNASRIRSNPIGIAEFWLYWHHNEPERSFNDWLSELWDESNQCFRLPGKRNVRGGGGNSYLR